MVAALALPSVDGVSVSSIDRLFRPEDFSFLLLQEFHKHRKVIISTKEGYVEPWTPEGWATCMRAAMQAGSELFETKRRSRGGRKKAHAQQKPCNTGACYGILYVDKYSRDANGRSQYFMEDPEGSSVGGLSKREVVRNVFDWRSHNRLRTSAIRRRLNDAGILTAGLKKKDGSWQYKPGPWSRQTVIQMLKNRHYIGEHCEGGKLVDVPCPQFIERDVFEGVQAMFKESKEIHNGRPTTKHLLSGFLRHRKCNRRYNTKGGRYPSYISGNRDNRLGTPLCDCPQIRCTTIEDVAFHAIWRILTQAEILLANAKAYYDSLPSQKATAKLEKNRAVIQSRIERTRRMVKIGTEDEDKGNAEILEDMREVAKIQAELRAANSVMGLPPLHVIEAGCRQIAEGPAPETYEERRPILEKLADLKIFYDHDHIVEITGKVPVPVPDAAVSPKRNCKGRIGADPESQ
jgi:hypothetical protein